MLAATMKYLGISLNPITSINLATSIGIGLDYTIHLTHRISDELTIKNTTDALINTINIFVLYLYINIIYNFYIFSSHTFNRLHYKMVNYALLE